MPLSRLAVVQNKNRLQRYFGRPIGERPRRRYRDRRQRMRDSTMKALQAADPNRGLMALSLLGAKIWR